MPEPNPTKRKRVPVPQTDVLAWLAENHPALHAVAELERSRCWLPVDLRGDHNKPARESIKNYGFIYSRKGGHALPSGKLGTWGHACTAPLPFYRKGKGKPAPTTETNALDAEALAFSGLA